MANPNCNCNRQNKRHTVGLDRFRGLCKPILRKSLFGVATVAISLIASINQLRAASDKAASTPVNSSVTVAANIAVINMQYIIQNAAATKAIQKSADEKRNALKSEVEEYEAMLRSEQDQLKDLVNRNAAEAQAQKTAFENKLTDVRNKISARSKVLSDIFGEARGKVFQTLVEIVEAYAKKNNINLLVSSEAVVFQDGFDITNIILGEVDKELPFVPLDFSKLIKE